ncbi:hypothetical protein SAMN05216428_102360 [Nitrosospira sp. Nsp11]|uniref:terminase small subunit-like protein n=1 Tax=Nitrosospira sp. Nsp11 TaxID=1855338 RepID=UPI00091275F0|nr:hypothetical protein [Nitrosospira sp. Nsp11]SHL42405.1 hypothetical protein SAMN05216428_102360 [Nitrosospira sp. Nsp11]
MSEVKKPAVKSVRKPAPKKPAKRKVGAPTIKTPALLEKICTGIAMGVSARAMCLELKISQRVLWNWLASDEEFMQQYARAKERCADVYAEEIIEIADDNRFDIRVKDDGSEVTDNEVVQRSRLRVDARKWYASKLAPKKYGDRVVNEHEGGDPDKPLLSKIEISFVPTQKPQS